MGFARLAEGLYIYIYIPRVTCARSLRALTAADPGFRVGWGGGHRWGWCEAALGSVLEGGTPAAQLAGMGEGCKLPRGVCCGAPEDNAYGVENPPPMYALKLH